MVRVTGLKLWLRARRPRLTLTVFALQALHPWLASQTLVPLPDLLLGDLVDTPIAVLAPIIMVAMVQVILDTDKGDRIACPLVRFHLFDVGLLVALAAVGLISGLIGSWQMDSYSHLIWARNSLIYLGIACVSRTIGATRAMTIGPLIAGMAVVLFGRGQTGEPSIWALTLRPPDTAASIGVAAAVFLVGASLAAVQPPHNSRLITKGLR